MICTVLQNMDFTALAERLDGCEMAEIRLDSCELTLREIEELFSSDVPTVATCRLKVLMDTVEVLKDPALTEQSRLIKASQIAEKRLVKAIEAGASFVDVEIEAPKQMSKRVREAAHEYGAVFIRSWHDNSGTPSYEELKEVVEKCRYHGADMVKIVTAAKCDDDCKRVLSLYDEYEPYGLIAFCMGDAGRQSRLDCLAKGGPFSYAAPDDMPAAAPGQWKESEMAGALYGSFRPWKGKYSSIQCSKSFAQRAIIVASLAEGISHLHNYTPCADNEAAIEVARKLGASVVVDGHDVTITGIGSSLSRPSGSISIQPTDSCSAQSSDSTSVRPGSCDVGRCWPDCVDVGESGLLARLMIPLCAQFSDGPVRIEGSGTLLRRSMDGVPAMMASFGAKVVSNSEENRAENASSGCFVPLTVEGPLMPGNVAGPLTSGNASGSMASGNIEVLGRYGSQLISGLLMALPFADKATTLTVKDPKSIPYMFITLEVLKKFGVKITNEMLGGRDFLESDGDWTLCTEMVFKVRGGQKYKAADIDLEGDWSSAANYLVAGAVFGSAVISGLDTRSLQADLSIMDVLMDAGASLSQLDGDTGDICVRRAPLSAFRINATHCPDLFPVVSVLAAFCQGENHIEGIGRLVHKESDRGQAILEMLNRMGVEAGIMDDELVVIGQSLQQRMLTGNLLKGGNYSSFHDHRMVMALKVAALGADSPVIIDDEQCVAKSCPGFSL